MSTSEIALSPGRTTLRFPDGITCEIDLIDAIEARDRCIDEAEKEPLGPSSGFAHVRKFADWFKEHTKIALSLGHADELMDMIVKEFNDQKKARRGSPS